MTADNPGRRWAVAVAGCGSIGRMHVRAFKELGANVVAVSSRRVEQARAVAEAEGCEFTTDAEALVRRPDVELVAVTTSSGSHARVTLAAIAAGKHVVVEKPMAMSPSDAGQMIAAAEARGVMLSVISQRRFEPTHQAVKRAQAPELKTICDFRLESVGRGSPVVRSSRRSNSVFTLLSLER